MLRAIRENRPGLWAKTFSALLIGMEDWYSTRCRLTWRLKGTKYNRLYFQLQPSTHRTVETEYGSSPSMLPTPTTQETPHYEAELTETGRRRASNGNSHSLNLADHALRGLLPTPNAAEGEKYCTTYNPNSQMGKALTAMAHSGLLPTPRANQVNGCDLNNENIANRNKENLEETVASWVVSGMIPTPTARDWRSPDTNPESSRQMADSELNTAIYKLTGSPSQLSPHFVMEMMGFPPDWTLLPFLNGDRSPSRQEAMQ